MSDLADELKKVLLTLVRYPQAKARFYSRSEFGDIAQLREYSILYGNEIDYRTNLTKEKKHTKTNASLAALISKQNLNLSTYEFLRRTSFNTDPDFDQIDINLRSRLRQMASNSDAAFNALWVRLHNLSGRVEGSNLSASAQYRLAKEDLEEILHQAGAMLVPTMAIKQVRT